MPSDFVCAWDDGNEARPVSLTTAIAAVPWVGASSFTLIVKAPVVLSPSESVAVMPKLSGSVAALAPAWSRLS
jgi:hypothetical protein